MTTYPASVAEAGAEAFLHGVVARVATGPEYSKDLTQGEAREALGVILDGPVDPVRAGIYLIALRMKRETLDENAGSLEALLARTHQVVADVDEVVDIAEPYDGFARNLPMGAFLPAVLAACGSPAVCHGTESVGPKFGVTIRQVLTACGRSADLPMEEVGRRVSDPDCGWAYADQSRSCPSLHALRELRTRIVKRPVITTVEVLTGPVRGRRATHLVTGYVHKPYPPVYAHLARLAGFDSALIVRGVEGGIFPSLRQAGLAFGFHGDDEETAWEFHAQDLEFAFESRGVPLPEDDKADVAAAAAEAGCAALRDREEGPARGSLLYATAMILAHKDRSRDSARHIDAVGEAIDSGRAWDRFTAGE